MSPPINLERFLDVDSDDVGCNETFALLHLYVERELAHQDAADFYPDIGLHLERCGPCAEDYRGLLALLA